jgi:hypothetical protein
MRILHFDEFLLCYAGESGLTDVGYTGKLGLPGVAYTGVAYTDDSAKKNFHKTSPM